nr:MAG: portal protein [Bacteriophage sp.]UVX76552.1 MAG: portal protein [Bacteriophage sp.]UWF98555.1 MAG: portal protein [Bacteriophage sp.]
MQKRLRFHTETNIAVSDINQPTALFLDWVRNLLPKDKYNIFLQLFKFPLSTPAVVEDVYRELERVFYSRNSSSSYQFTDSELAEDWADYRKNKLNEPDIWKTVGWKKMQVSINSILVVDLPQVQMSVRPEPYFYWLEIEDVVDYEMVNDTEFKWIVFRQPNRRIAAFDDTYIRVYQLNEKNEIASLVSEATHNLGYCPARFFWSTQLNEKNKDLKKNPISKELSNLDWYLFFSISKQHLDLYAPYPIYSAYAADCNFENNETGDYCDGGFLRNSSGEYKILNDGTVEKCPCCSEKRIAGPGSFLEVPIPNQAEGIVDMRNPVQITTIDKDSLTYNVEECVRLRNDIIVSIAGSGGTVSEKEAINETQVAANFESKTSVLNALKTNFELAQKFVEDTICRFRYGSDFISSSISWGTEFYVFTVKELYNKYEQAKTNGASESELDAITQQILEVEYRNNPLVLQRMLILKQLEPYPHKTLDEVLKLHEKKLLNENYVKLKINFSTLVERFERENINIIEFASARTFSEKIKLITDKLLDYVREENDQAGVSANQI